MINDYVLESINNDKYIELTLNLDNAQFTVISVTGLFEQLAPQKYSQMHYHDCYEAFCIEDGSLTLRTEEETLSYSKNDLIIISPYTTHTLVENNVTNKFRDRILFLVKKNTLKNTYPLYEKITAVLEKNLLYLKTTTDICDSFKTLKDNIIAKDTLMASLNMHKIITHIIRATKEIEGNAPSAFMPDTAASRSNKIQMIIGQYYNSNISLQYIAKNLNLSTRQVSRMINRLYGCTYRELICEMRMKTAMELILSSDLSMTEIAMETGFKSTKGFYKAFKGYYGSLPTNFRKNVTK